jgi:glycerate 2-kinase
MKVVIAPDKFKRTLSAPQAAAAMAAGVRHAVPEVEIELVPLADGGEGTAECLQRTLGGESVTAGATDALGRPMATSYAMLSDGSAAIDMAAASGLHLIEPSPHSALTATTFGTGELIRHAAREGATRLLVGVGGSAGTDGGTGAARAIGWRFVDVDGDQLQPGGGELTSLARVIPPARGFDLPVVGICDVMNPLVGPKGAARVFGPQKGARPEDVERLESGSQRLAEVLRESLGIEIATGPGAGAGGGMGAGLLAFFDASLRAGFDFVSETLRLEEVISAGDLVVTGEGSLDPQSSLGKVVGGVARLARRHGVPCVAVAGRVDETAARSLGLASTGSLIETVGPREAQSFPERSLAAATELVVKSVWQGGPEAY